LPFTFFSAGLLLVIAVVLFAYGSAAMWDQVVTFHQAARKTFRATYASNMRTILGTFSEELILCGLSLIGIVASFFCIRHLAAVILSAFAGCALFLLSHVPLWTHHCVILLPALALGFGGLWYVLFEYSSENRFARMLAVVSGVMLVGYQVNTSIHSSRWIWWDRRELPDCAAYIAMHTQPDELILSDDPMLAFRLGRKIPAYFCDTSFVRVRSGYLPTDTLVTTARESCRLIVFRSGRFKELNRRWPWLPREDYSEITFRDGTQVFHKR
jgi:hypothetical protein